MNNSKNKSFYLGTRIILEIRCNPQIIGFEFVSIDFWIDFEKDIILLLLLGQQSTTLALVYR